VKVFHGSNCDFAAVDLNFAKDKRDFGRGFYVTTLREQARDWAQTLYTRYRGAGSFVYEFELNIDEDWSVKRFAGLTADWLELVRENRVRGGCSHSFDAVQGPVADDRTHRALALYVAGIYDVETTLRQLRYQQANDQISLHTARALTGLSLTKKTRDGN
jgi:hypothetical protein